MKPTWLWLFQALLISLILPMAALAQEEEADLDYSEMSLEDLLNVEVVTASKQAESSWDAPAVITTVTAAEIKQFGNIQLREILERVTGITPNRSDGIWQNVSIRGGDSNPDSSNVHMLLLVDGRPIRESYDGSSNFVPLAVFPVEAIKRIEVVRGPGSVLYGTNAFEGVVNIITHVPDQDDFVEVSGQAGSDSGKGFSVAASHSTEDFYINIAAKAFEEDGPIVDTLSFSGTPNGLDNDFQDNLGIYGTMGYKGLSFAFYYGDTDYNAISFGPEFLPLTVSTTQKMFNLGYSREISDKWSFQIDYTKNIHDFDYLLDARFLDGSSLINRSADDQLIEATFFGSLTDKLAILFGGVYETIEGGSSTGEVRDYDEGRYSAYVQADYRPNDKFKLIVGGQLNKIENVDASFVPRIGGIYNFNESVGIKVLYGEAFRSPAKLQTDQVVDAEFGGFGPNPNLEPETTATTDIQLYIKKGNYQFAITAFNNEEEELINVTENPDPAYDFFFDNTSGRTLRGFELEGKYVFDENWFMQGSFVSNESESSDNVKDITLQPDTVAKLGVSYTGSLITAGAFYSKFDAYKDNIIIFPERVAANDASDDWDSITLNATFHFKIGGTKLDLNLYGRNVQDEEVHVPQNEVADTNTITYNLAAQYYATLRARF